MANCRAGGVSLRYSPFVFRLTASFVLILGCEPTPLGQFVPHSQIECCGAEVVDFGEVRFGREAAAVVEFSNSGTATLEYSLLVSAGSDFRVLNDGGRLEAGGTAFVGMRAFPTSGPGTIEGTLLLTDISTGYEEAILLTVQVPEDADGDGFSGEEFGGDDCDDGDPDVYPGAMETWYDSVDQDCDGASDFDQDGDGSNRYPEGEDCDDQDAGVSPLSAERQDGLDNDCDGLIDEDGLSSGDLLVNEWMVSSSMTSFIELENRSANPLYLDGWQLVVNGVTWNFPKGISIPPEGLAVLCADSEPAVAWTCDAEFSGGESMGISGGSVSVSVPQLGLRLDGVKWSSDWGVTYDVAQERLGACDSPSLSADPSCWCPATTEVAVDIYGSPGALNGCL